ncbi:helicase-associated domain-containing protein [Paenibacillus sp. p3-SID1389]|uniref:helicase-associated domain-containing protein n=1 Tax=Paenibacillus sp. p3-SID1389 TaxID=2916364 RepID=UPI0021A7B935|nr:helicase-associated domain-containing protein [Paenibacillus sp. p3-SID1389]MCT2197012.1 helicase-associated domain-containing protein [Paenibacillus sp. p3-SID1389]
MSRRSEMPAYEDSLIDGPVREPLNEAEMEALRLLFRRYAGQPFRLEQANAAAAGSLSGADIRAALPVLLRSGEIAAVRKAWGEKLFYIPLDRQLEMWKIWGYAELREQNPVRVELEREAKPGLALDLFRALTWIAGNGLRMTAKGTIHQKEHSKLEDRIALKAEDIAGLQLNYPHPDVYSPALAVVMDLLLALGLIAKERAVWRADVPGMAAWLSLDVPAMNFVLMRELQRYVPADVGLQHVALRLTAPDLKPGAWYSVEELLGSLQDQGLLGGESGDLSPERAAWIEGWLEALCGCGWMELGRHPEDGRMFRWLIERDASSPTASPSAKGKLIVQPDFELLVPPDVPFTVRFELEACAELASSGVMSVYRLTRAGLEQACKLGRTPQEILQLLEEHSAGVPASVRDGLLQWGREIGRTTLTEVKLLSCADTEAADRIADLPSLAGKLERIGPLHFLVTTDSEAEVIKILESERLAPVHRGTPAPNEPILPKLTEMEITWSNDEGPSGQKGQGWIYKGADLHFYEPETRPPEVDELFPGLSEIPVMWWKELRRYHASTARELIERALAWSAKLMLQIGGESVVCLPLAVVESETDWQVRVRKLPSSEAQGKETPGEEVLLSPRDWQAIRLILPTGLRK